VVEGKVTMSRPVCAWPLVVRYRGRGDTGSADSFTCAKP
jgi:feruloyl esterase